MAATRPTPRRRMRLNRALAVTADQLNLAELRAYARRTGGPDTFDRAALLKHIHDYHQHNHNNDNDDGADT